MRRSITQPIGRQVERQASRMAEMIEHLGVDAGKLVRREGGAAFAEARDKCLHCTQTRQCFQFLEQNAESQREPAFCANLDVFTACQAPRAPDYEI